MAAIQAADKVQLTTGRITNLQCAGDKKRVYLWDSETKGFGVIATDTGGKSFILQTKLNSQSLRITIGKVSAWSIPEARAEARRLQVLIDQGTDPRQAAADKKAANQAAAAAKKVRETRETVTLSMAWDKYLIERKPFWGDRHYRDHEAMMQSGGEKRKRSRKLTEPGVLQSLANVKLVDLTPERVQQWATKESATRAGRARLALRLLKAFLSWCSEQPEYREIVVNNSAKNKKTREILGKPETFDEVLQREQLPAWFNAIKQIQNPVMSAYLQILLLIGSRPNELAALKWEDVDFQWGSMTIRDKIDGTRTIGLTPYTKHLLTMLPRRNEWVFSSLTSASGHLEDPHSAHNKVCEIAGLTLTIYGLRRSFATLSEWIETPAGIASQIQGHKPNGTREKHYVRRPLDLLRMWHIKIEQWILEQAGINFIPTQAGLQAVK